LTERYAVRQGILNDILMRLRLPMPDLDVFADGQNARMAWCDGSDGEVADAFEAHWGLGSGLLWMNPPYSALEMAVQKVISDGAEAIMVLQDWRSTRWWK
jgi:hypothetical protein